jgi:hypothetical protein
VPYLSRAELSQKVRWEPTPEPTEHLL